MARIFQHSEVLMILNFSGRSADRCGRCLFGDLIKLEVAAMSETSENSKESRRSERKNGQKVHKSIGINLDRQEIKVDNELKVNRTISLILMFVSFAGLICLLLNEFGVLPFDANTMRIILIPLIVMYLIPFFIAYVFRQNKRSLKVIIVVDIILYCVLLYSILSYNVVIAFAFPLLACMAYFNKKLFAFTSALSILGMGVGHVLAFYIDWLGYSASSTIENSLIFGYLPSAIIFLLGVCVGYLAVDKASGMIDETVDNSQEVGRMTGGVQMVMQQTQMLIGTRKVDTLASLIANSFSDLLTSMLKLNIAPKGVVGVLMGEKFYTVDSVGTAENICRDLGDEIGFEFSNARFKFEKQIRDGVSVAEIREGFISMKFYNNGKLVGFLVYRQDVDDDDYSLREVAKVFCTNTTSIIDNTMLTSDMFRTQEQLAYSLAVVSENSSQETGQHIRRVSEYARIMGRYVCDSEEQLETFRIAAMLHDIGKLKIPKEIIEKPGKLTAEEFGKMKKHVIYGRDIIGDAPGEVMEMARRIILHHHERWDGTGYLGVAGEDIDKFARYVSVCDVFDALLSRRSYKEAWPAQKVYEEITSQSGRQFDPKAVEAFKKCYVEMLQIRDKFPDDDLDEENIVTTPSEEEKQEAEQKAKEEEIAKKRVLPQINIDPSIVTPISV